MNMTKIEILKADIEQSEAELDSAEEANKKARRQGVLNIDYTTQNRLQDEINTARAELSVLEAEEAEAKKSRIRDVVEQTADISAELAGRIVLRLSFAGSVAKTKKLTRAEKDLVLKSESDINATEGDKKLNLALVGGEKRLFDSKEYDALMSFINTRRDEFATFGIPFLAIKSANVVDITRIPEIEALAEKTEAELKVLVERLMEKYPEQITPEATKLGPLYNAADYPKVERLKSLFRFSYTWMAFGVPDELKNFNVRFYEKAQKKAIAQWKEIEAKGVLLLRETIADLVGVLEESLTQKPDGTKRKFYATSVTNIKAFCETFAGRNICGDAELDEQIVKLNDLVSGVDLKAMSTDEKLRASVKRDITAAKEGLYSLLVDAKARVIVFDEEVSQ